MQEQASKPLKGVKVLDFGHTIMGPCAGLIFADLGADVIKVEPYEGDPTRNLPGFAAGFFTTFGRNKRSIALDLKNPRGQETLHRLVGNADIVLENFGAGTIERLGCGWDALERINPRLIFLSMKGFLKGPYERRGALDEVVQMQSGLAYMTGPPGRPLRAGASIIDILGAVFGVVAVLAALHERQGTGRGKRVGSSLFESAAFLMSPQVAGSVVTGEPMLPFPARKNAWGVYDVFDVTDGQVFIGITSDAHWMRFCREFPLGELADDARLGSNTGRVDHRDHLIPAVAAMLAAMPSADVLARAEAAGIPFARVGHPNDLAHDPHLLQGGLMQVVLAAAGLDRVAPLPGLPLEFGDARERPSLERQPPRISEHGTEILTEAGFVQAEIDDLIAGGVLRSARA